jgi:hypothetical protein
MAPESLWQWTGSPPRDLVLRDSLRVSGGAGAWASTVVLVTEQTSGRQLVHKYRRLLPTELVEIEQMLARVASAAIPQLPHITGWAVHAHFLHLVLERVDGVTLRTDNEGNGTNAKAVADFLADMPVRQKIGQTLDLLAALVALHANGLVFQDLTLEQLIVAGDTAKLVDLDTIVLSGGVCASRASWLPADMAWAGSGCSRDTDRRLAGRCIAELFNGQRELRETGTFPLHVHAGLSWLANTDGGNQRDGEMLRSAIASFRRAADAYDRGDGNLES